MYNKLIDWYQSKHPLFAGDNNALQPDSELALQKLSSELLAPIQQQFGSLIVTYGFTAFELLSYIKNNSPGDMAPELDQHAAFELNSRGNRICKRDGAVTHLQ